MESVLIMCNKSPFGTNSAIEAIRLGAGFIALGELLDCKIFLYGEAVLSMKRGLNSTKIGLDSFLSFIFDRIYRIYLIHFFS